MRNARALILACLLVFAIALATVPAAQAQTADDPNGCQAKAYAAYHFGIENLPRKWCTDVYAFVHTGAGHEGSGPVQLGKDRGWKARYIATNPSEANMQIEIDHINQNGLYYQQVWVQADSQSEGQVGAMGYLPLGPASSGPLSTRYVDVLAAVDDNGKVAQNVTVSAWVRLIIATPDPAVLATLADQATYDHGGIVKERMRAYSGDGPDTYPTWEGRAKSYRIGNLVAGEYSADITITPVEQRSVINAEVAGLAITNFGTATETTELWLTDVNGQKACASVFKTLQSYEHIANMLAGDIFPESCFPATGKNWQGRLHVKSSHYNVPFLIGVAGITGAGIDFDFTPATAPATATVVR